MTEEREPAYMDPEHDLKHHSEAEPFCSICGGLMAWEPCWNGCDEGYIDLYEEDPLFYDEDDCELCQICEGRGGYWVCMSSDKHGEPANV